MNWDETPGKALIGAALSVVVAWAALLVGVALHLFVQLWR